MFRISILSFVVLSSSLVGQVTLHVDIAGGAPFISIQSAIDAASNGDTVLVAPGIYDEAIVIAKSITVRSTDGATVTAIAPSAVLSTPGVIIAGSNNSVTFEGFRVTAHNSASQGVSAGGIHIDDADAVIRGCAVTGCIGPTQIPDPIIFAAPNGGVGGILVSGFNANATIENCLVAGNQGGAGGFLPAFLTAVVGNGGAGGIHFAGLGTNVVRHCTVADNLGGAPGTGTFIGIFGMPITVTGNGGTGGLTAPGNGVVTPSMSVQNSIVWGNQSGGPGGATQISGMATVSNTDIPGGSPVLGNISADPAFVSPAAGDYSIASSSPCVDAGVCSVTDPQGLDLAGHRRLRGFSPDMGAYEFQHDTTRMGTSEDLLLTTVVNGHQGGALNNTKTLAGGDTLDIHWESPCGSLDGSIYYLAGQFFVPGMPPLSLLPHVFVDPVGGVVVQGPASMIAGGETISAVIPPGSFAPTIVRFQVFVVSASAQVFPFPLLTSDAHDLVFQ